MNYQMKTATVRLKVSSVLFVATRPYVIVVMPKYATGLQASAEVFKNHPLLQHGLLVQAFISLQLLKKWSVPSWANDDLHWQQ